MFLRKILTSKIITTTTLANLTRRHKVTFKDLYEPDYLDELKPPIPVYDLIDIQIKGYDYRVLENFQRYIHKLSTNMGIEVEDSWATPLQKLQVKRFRPNSSIVDGEYTLDIYERNVQVADVSSTGLTTLLRVIEAALPEGCTMQAREHLPEYEEILYVPDKQLKELKDQLDSSPAPEKKKK